MHLAVGLDGSARHPSSSCSGPARRSQDSGAECWPSTRACRPSALSLIGGSFSHQPTYRLTSQLLKK